MVEERRPQYPSSDQAVFIFGISTVVSILASCGALGINGSEIAEFYLLRARDFQCNFHNSQAEQHRHTHIHIQRTRHMQSLFIACVCLFCELKFFQRRAVLSIYLLLFFFHQESLALQSQKRTYWTEGARSRLEAAIMFRVCQHGQMAKLLQNRIPFSMPKRVLNS